MAIVFSHELVEVRWDHLIHLPFCIFRPASDFIAGEECDKTVKMVIAIPPIQSWAGQDVFKKAAPLVLLWIIGHGFICSSSFRQAKSLLPMTG